MRIIDANDIVFPLSQLIETALFSVENSACEHVRSALKAEPHPLAKWALEKIEANNILAKKSGVFACQDCGQAVLFVTLGGQLFVEGNLKDALNKGVEWGYKAARKSVADSLDRTNTATNTPCIIHFDVDLSDKITIKFLAKGAGSENMSRLFMLTPSKGENGIIQAVVDTVISGGANACPPLVIGVGIGGTFEKCALLSKYALTRETGAFNCDKRIQALEKKILKRVNETQIGAQGLGGNTTALAVHVETFPTHIGMLPVAVNLQCHSVRHGTLVF